MEPTQRRSRLRRIAPDHPAKPTTTPNLATPYKWSAKEMRSPYVNSPHLRTSAIIVITNTLQIKSATHHPRPSTPGKQSTPKAINADASRSTAGCPCHLSTHRKLHSRRHPPPS